MPDRTNRNQVFQQDAPPGVPVKNQMRDDFGYEVPTETVPLPSRGLVYAEGTPLSNATTIDIRAMTAREEDILTSKALIKKGTVVTHLIQSCLVDKTIDAAKMLSGDRNAIMVAIRITGYGQEYVCDVECPACENKFKNEFDLAQLPIRQLDIPPVEPHTNLFECALPLTKKVIRFKFLTGAEEEEIVTTQERKRKVGTIVDNLVTARLSACVVSVDGNSDRNAVSSFVRGLPARDSFFLRKFIDANEPGVDMRSSVVCPSCDEESEVRMPIGAAFFWPDAG